MFVVVGHLPFYVLSIGSVFVNTRPASFFHVRRVFPICMWCMHAWPYETLHLPPSQESIYPSPHQTHSLSPPLLFIPILHALWPSFNVHSTSYHYTHKSTHNETHHAFSFFFIPIKPIFLTFSHYPWPYSTLIFLCMAILISLTPPLIVLSFSINHTHCGSPFHHLGHLNPFF